MKKIARIALAFFSLGFCAVLSVAQTPAGWLRVTSDNGEFSAEVPDQYDFFYDESGFQLSKDQSNYALKNVHIFNSFRENTLISFECFETKSGGSDALFKTDATAGNETDGKQGTVKFKQLVNKSADFYILRRYYRSKDHIYVATAASRKGETEALKHFFDSIVFKPDSSGLKPKLNFSSLKISKLELDAKEDPSYKPMLSNPPPSSLPDDPSLKRIQILSKPRVHYVDAARMRGVQGTIALRTTFNENGCISKFSVIKSLPEGLLRQTIFSALRIKFLPQEKDNVPEKVTKVVEYNFVLY